MKIFLLFTLLSICFAHRPEIDLGDVNVTADRIVELKLLAKEPDNSCPNPYSCLNETFTFPEVFHLKNF